MRPEFDRQIDSLLREHARRGGAAGGAESLGGPAGAREPTPAAASAAHLDADELSAFAENALPERARARHTAHLAECGQCRKLAAQIAMSAGVADEIERREKSLVAAAAAVAVPSPSAAASRARGWRERFAPLFGRGAWRYAMPLAALLVVSAAVLLVMSGRRRGEMGAVAVQRKESAQPSRGGDLHHAPDQGPQAGAAISQNHNAANAAPADAGAARPEGLTAEPQQGVPGSPAESAPVAPVGSAAGGGGGSPAAPTEAAKSLPADAAPPPATFAAGRTPAPTPASLPPAQEPPREVAAAATPLPAPAIAKLEDSKAAEAKEKDRFEERNAMRARKQSGHGPSRNMDQQMAVNRQADETQEAARARAAEGKSDDASRNKPKSSTQRSAGRAAAPAARDGGQRREDRSGMTLDGEDSGGEVRGAGGRRFRRRDGVWVDTAYKPSQATVRVSRGSEQYRSLVGDEPGIGRIADALGGELIVVWKGRAYRIK